MKQNNTKKMMQITLLLSLSIVLHFFDPPLPVPVPGVRLGLANIIGVIVLDWFGAKDMLFVNILRVLLVGLMRGTLLSLAFFTSLSGVLVSSFVIILLYKLFKPSILICSVTGAIFHPIGQIMAIVKWYGDFRYAWGTLPLILMFSIPTGILTGIVAEKALERLRRG